MAMRVIRRATPAQRQRQRWPACRASERTAQRGRSPSLRRGAQREMTRPSNARRKWSSVSRASRPQPAMSSIQRRNHRYPLVASLPSDRIGLPRQYAAVTCRPRGPVSQVSRYFSIVTPSREERIEPRCAPGDRTIDAAIACIAAATRFLRMRRDRAAMKGVADFVSDGSGGEDTGPWLKFGKPECSSDAP